MGELQHEAFQFTFNGFLKVAFQGSRITFDAGLILIRELDERLGLATLIAEHLSDSRQGLNTQFSLADLLRQSVYSRLAGYEDLNDAVRVSADPTFRLIGSPKLWDRGAALTSTLHWFETELLTRGRRERWAALVRGCGQAYALQTVAPVTYRCGTRRVCQARSSGSERDTRARPHAVAPMNCVPEDSRRRSTCTGRTHSPRALADGNQTPSSTVAVRAPSPS